MKRHGFGGLECKGRVRLRGERTGSDQLECDARGWSAETQW